MLSQVLVGIAKLSSSQRLFTESRRRLSTVATTPYLLMKQKNYRRAGSEMVVDLNLYDPRKDEAVKIKDLTLPEDLTPPSMRIGSSRGWVCVKNRDDSTVRITNIFNPSAPVSSHNVISLPPLELRAVSSMALSASPEQRQEDCVVAVKSRRLVSLCRPGDSVWTHIEVPFFASSEVVYSDKDSKFYVHKVSEEEEYDGPIDLIKTATSKFPQVSLFQRFPNSDIPKSRQDQVTTTSTIMDSQHLVESPSGHSFIVYWCNEYLNLEEWESRGQKGPPHKHYQYRKKPRGFVVYRQDAEQKIGSYTEDIGDLCIFLSRGVAFCVSATEYPGLKPNSIYYASFETGFGFYDLSSNTVHDVVIDEEDPFYHWLAPLSK